MGHKKAARAAKRATRKRGIFSRVFSGIAVGLGNVITLGLEKVTGKQFGRTTPEEFSRSKVGSALTIAAKVPTAALAIVTAPVTVPFVARAALQRPLAALVVGGLAATTGGRALIEKGAIGLVEGGKAAGELIEEKPDVSVGELLQTGGLVVAGLGAAALAPAAIGKAKDLFGGSPKGAFVKEDPIQEISPDLPVTPQTEVITPETATDKPKKTRRKVPSVKVNQSVNIIVQQNKKFLNKGIVIR